MPDTQTCPTEQEAKHRLPVETWLLEHWDFKQHDEAWGVQQPMYPRGHFGLQGLVAKKGVSEGLTQWRWLQTKLRFIKQITNISCECKQRA